MKSPSKKSQFGAWIRTMLLCSPAITIEALRTAYAKTKLPSYFKVMPANVAEGWSELKQRWGIAVPSDVPLHHGELNVSSMIRLYLDKYGMDKTEKEARAFFEEDGIELRLNAFATVKSVYAKNGGGKSPETKVEKTKVKRRRRVAKVEQPTQQNGEVVSTASQYEEIETAIDKLLVMADKLDNHSLFADLRTARRRASAAILS